MRGFVFYFLVSFVSLEILAANSPTAIDSLYQRCAQEVSHLALDNSSLEARLVYQEARSLAHIMSNFLPIGGVVASPSEGRDSDNEPNYYYVWVADAGIVALGLHKLYAHPSIKEEALIREFFKRYVGWTRRLHFGAYGHGADRGHAKFYVDGRPYDGPWGNPQNDGPALRALALIRYAEILLREHREVSSIYSSRLPAVSPLKGDLEYIAHHFADINFCRWEETKGQHYFHLVLSQQALIEGAALAEKLGDDGAARFYSGKANEIEAVLEKFWSEEKGHILSTISRPKDGHMKHKVQELDSLVLLGELYRTKDFSDDSRLVRPDLLATIFKLWQGFDQIYPINQRHPDATFFGRYPEDIYDGVGFSEGHPWFLTSFAFVEYLYRVAKLTHTNESARKAFESSALYQMIKSKSGASGLNQNSSLVKDYADRAFARLLHFVGEEGSISEQIHRRTEAMRGARDLTWSHIAFLRTLEARKAFEDTR